MKLICISMVLGCLLAGPARAQHLVWLDSSQQNASFRGLSTAPDGSIWVSGSKGTIGRSTSGGQQWQWVNPAGMAQRDFRDIVAFSSQVAVAMAVDSPGLIMRTTNGGLHWHTVYTDHRSGIFLDDMAFGENGEGVVLGDPIDGRFVMLHTTDSGKTWQAIQGPKALTGEACFAASGTNMALGGGQVRFVTGGTVSRLHTLHLGNLAAQKAEVLPIAQGSSSAGANALASAGEYSWVVGGNFSQPNQSDSCLAVFHPKAKQWMRAPIALPYQSAMVLQPTGLAISCGTAGIYAIQLLPHSQWRLTPISSQSFHVIRAAAKPGTYYVAGGRGRIARIEYFPEKH